MYILVSYDIKTTTPEGQTQLRRVAKMCQNYGQRVQHSVFECKVDEGQYVKLKHSLYEIIDENVDNLRFYRLGKNYKSTVETLGVNKAYEVDAPIIL